MAEIILDLKKSVQENASDYFEHSKKAKKKIAGALEAIRTAKEKLEALKKKQTKAEEKARRLNAEIYISEVKKEWYEKFRWFLSSEGFLVIGGRDATSNEIVVKKHTEKEDFVFHTDMAGSPFFIVKVKSNSAKTVGEATLKEVADATCSYSRAWKLGLTATETFWVKPEQVSKETESGEYIGKGAFMIRGKTNYVPSSMNLAVGLTKEGRIMGGPLSAVKKNCEKYLELKQGKEKTSETAKKIKAKIGGSLDDIIRVMPSGGCEIKK